MANKTRQKCHVNCVGGMPEGSVITKIAWASAKLYDHSRFSTQGSMKEPTGESQDVMPLSEFVPDGPRLRNREKSELYESNKSENLR